MSALSIQLNRMAIGARHLEGQEIDPAHKTKIENCLSKIYQQNTREVAKKNIPFKIEFNVGGPTFHIEDRKIALNKSPELKRVERVVRYYQHTGHLPRPEFQPKDAIQRETETKKSVRALNQASLPGANGNILAGMRLADDTLSLTRNILFAIPDIGPKDPVVNHLGYYAGIFWTFFSFRELDEGVAEYKRSMKVSDSEGKRRAQARVLSGGIVSAASITYLAGKFCDSYATAAAGSTVLGASNILFGVGSLVAIGVSLLGAIRCDRFNKRLNKYLENPALSDVQKLQGALQFLKDSISVTPEERAELAVEIDQKHPDWSVEKKEQLLQQKLADLTEVKVKHMKRRTSNKSLFLILSKADTLLTMLSCKETCAEGIKEASILINQILQENKIKLSLYTLGFIAATLSFLGMVLMSFMTGGLLPFALYGIAGTIYLAMTIYTIAGTLFKKDYFERPSKRVF